MNMRKQRDRCRSLWPPGWWLVILLNRLCSRQGSGQSTVTYQGQDADDRHIIFFDAAQGAHHRLKSSPMGPIPCPEVEAGKERLRVMMTMDIPFKGRE